MKKNILLFCLIVSVITVQAQRKFSYGIELGVNASTTPSVEIYKDRDKYISIKSIINPIISPKLGIWSKYEIGKHLYANLGFQFNKVGYNFTNVYNGYDQNQQASLQEIYEESLIVNKLSVPATIGYQTKIGKNTFYIGLGYKKQYQIDGSVNLRLIIREGNTYPPRDIKYSSKLFDDNEYIVRRWNSGLQVETGFSISEILNIELAYGLNQDLRFRNIHLWEGLPNRMNNHELSLSFKYTLQQRVKKLE